MIYFNNFMQILVKFRLKENIVNLLCIKHKLIFILFKLLLNIKKLRYCIIVKEEILEVIQVANPSKVFAKLLCSKNCPLSCDVAVSIRFLIFNFTFENGTNSC